MGTQCSVMSACDGDRVVKSPANQNNVNVTVMESSARVPNIPISVSHARNVTKKQGCLPDEVITEKIYTTCRADEDTMLPISYRESYRESHESSDESTKAEERMQNMSNLVYQQI